MKPNRIGLLFCMLLLIASCKTNNKFQIPAFPVNREAEITDISHPDSLIPISWNLEWDGDHIVSNVFFNQHWIHLMNPDTGEIERDYVLRGDGPGEVLFSFGIRHDNPGWRIYDGDQNMIYTYDDSLRYLYRNELKLDSLPIITNVYFIDKGRTVVMCRPSGDDSHENICVTGGGSCGNVYSGNPLDFDEEMSIYFSRERFCYDPVSSRFATGSVYGGVIETFDTSGNKLVPKSRLLLYPLELSKDPDFPGRSIDCIIGVTAMACDRGKVITALCGERNSDASTDITVWDWDLNPLARYSTDEQILSMIHGRNKDELYAIVANDGMGKLVKILCPGLDDL